MIYTLLVVNLLYKLNKLFQPHLLAIFSLLAFLTARSRLSLVKESQRHLKQLDHRENTSQTEVIW